MKINLFSIICLSLFIAWNTPVLAETLPDGGVAAYCFDGDTFKLMDRRVARLAGIDAPEVAHNETPPQLYSRQAKKFLIDLVKGKRITLEYPGIRPRDNYGRLVIEAILPDGSSVNERLVEAGAAFFYPHKDLGPEFQERLRNLQAEAIQERRGMWEKLLAMPIARQPYIGNRESLRFFPTDCEAARHIKPRNRVNFGNLMDAFLAGYAPARICPFWPVEQR